MSATPMNIGMYHFARMMTSKSTPVVLSISPERIQVTSEHDALLDAPPGQLGVKISKFSGAITLIAPAGKLILAGVGSSSGAAHSPRQEAEIQQVQQAASQDPQLSQIALAQTLWVGRTTSVDGTYSGGLRSIVDGDAAAQKKIGKIVHEALTAAGVRPA